MNKPLITSAIVIAILGFMKAPRWSQEYDDIVESAGLGQPSRIPWSKQFEEVPPHRAPAPIVMTRDISSYHLQMERRGHNCVLKVYENLPGWQRKLIGQWSGTNQAECENKWKNTSQVVNSVVFKRKHPAL